MYLVCFASAWSRREAFFAIMVLGTIHEEIQAAVHYFLPGSKVLSLREHGSGHIHKTYRVNTDAQRASGIFLVQQFNQTVFQQPEQVAANIARVHAHLAVKSLDKAILNPVANPDRHFFYHSPAGHLWRMFDFISGGFSVERAASPQQAYLAGKAFGNFAALLSDLDPSLISETIPGFHDSVKRWLLLEPVIASDPAGRVSEMMPLIEEVNRYHGVFFEIRSLPIPLRVVHNDAKLGNVLFDKTTEQILAVTDWDTIMPGLILADFGDLARSLISPAAEDSAEYDAIQVRLPYFEALCKGFLEETAGMLTSMEKTHLVLGAQWIILEQALRFLCDYLAGDVYYPVQYPEHNKVRALNQMHLFRSVLAAENAMQAAVGKFV